MAIDKISNINNIIEPKKTKPAAGTKETKKNDSVQISSEGKKAAEISKQMQIVHETPDIRADRVNAIKEQIKNGSYDFNDNKVLEMVASKIANFLLRP
ncbi:MAG: flagellar biosynthesis anti-sigma factor FlgM [Spirochaetae bacterium HGW-Spirochaetae-1]|jgi:negative regulator of flagellin synthesis FlgM|nr:MAG: flagellar biosynthesis anti-sigma factor FlgM [Spirochaetae bacterium HGW-Spirochaetae-1]